MIYDVKKDTGTFCVPTSIFPALAGATKRDITALLYLLEAIGEGVCDDLDAIAERAGVTRAQLEAAAAYWRGAGVLTACDNDESVNDEEVVIDAKENEPEKTADNIEKKPKKIAETAELDAEAVIEAMKEDVNKSLINACQQAFGKMFNTSECSSVIGLRVYYGFDDEYIIMLAAYCARHGKKTVRYLEKMASSLYEENVETTKQLEINLRRRDELLTLTGRVRRICGLGERALTSKENDILARWQTYSPDDEMIALEYEKTVNATGKPSIPYMDKILTSWHEKNYSAADVEESKEKNIGSFDTDEFFRMAVERGHKKSSDK